MRQFGADVIRIAQRGTEKGHYNLIPLLWQVLEQPF